MCVNVCYFSFKCFFLLWVVKTVDYVTLVSSSSFIQKYCFRKAFADFSIKALSVLDLVYHMSHRSRLILRGGGAPALARERGCLDERFKTVTVGRGLEGGKVEHKCKVESFPT